MNCLILGAGPNQLELIKKANLRGFFTIVVTPYDSDPGVSIAGAYIKADIKNISEILRQSAQFRPSMCITDQSDVGALSQARICAALSIPCMSIETAESFCNKYKCYATILAAGKQFHPDTIYFEKVEPAADYLAEKSSERSSLLVKPINSQGSKGVSRLGSIDDVQLLTQALDESDGAGFVIQQYVEGRHFSIDAVIAPGHYSTLVVAEKTKYLGNPNLDKRLVLTSENHDAVPKSLVDFHREVVYTLGLPRGLTHGEYVLSEDGAIFLIEVAARGGGGNISAKVIKYVTGFDPLDFIIDSGVDSVSEILVDSNSQRCAILHFFDIDTEIDESLGALNILNLLHFEYRKPIIKMGTPKDSRLRPGYFIVGGQTLAEALANELAILAQLGLRLIGQNSPSDSRNDTYV